VYRNPYLIFEGLLDILLSYNLQGTNKNQIRDVFHDYFVNVGKNIEDSLKLKGYEEKS